MYFFKVKILVFLFATTNDDPIKVDKYISRLEITLDAGPGMSCRTSGERYQMFLQPRIIKCSEQDFYKEASEPLTRGLQV